MKADRPATGNASGEKTMCPGAGLVLEAVGARLGDFALGPLSLSLEPGGYLVLLGPSGCGKTSLLKALCGLQPLSGGNIRLGGHEIGDRPPERRRVGYLAQVSQLFPHLDVAGNIAFALGYSPLPPAERDRLFARLVALIELQPLLRRHTHNLSGGESRRVALARCLAASPRLLLLDEPLSMLDPGTRESMLRIIRRLHRETGMSAVHVTHDREEARAFEDSGTCALMRAGRLEQVGPVEKVFRFPETGFAASFLGAGNVVPARFGNGPAGPEARTGPLRWPLARPAGTGDGFLLFRPETLALAPRPGVPAVAGTVLGRNRRGIYTELVVETEALGVLRAHLAAGEIQAAPAPGQRAILYPGEAPLPLR